jgi:hypothetical protein
MVAFQRSNERRSECEALGGHIDETAPWTAAATSSRPYSATGNRFSEYCNTGPGAGP